MSQLRLLALCLTLLAVDVSHADPCIRSCVGITNGDYQSCHGCDIYVTCSNGLIYDYRPCPSGLVWDDDVKRCEYVSATCPGSQPETLTISCDNVLDALYADGQHITFDTTVSSDWTKVDQVDVPAGAGTLAVKCSDVGVVPGVMAATSGGVVTDNASGRWRCTNQFEDGWSDAIFNDAHWPVAVVKGNNGAYPWNKVLPDMATAKWIWTSASGGTVYCRAKLN